MGLLQRLPFILAGLMTFIVGVVSLNSSVDSSVIYLRMIASMIIFYIIGLLTRSTITKTNTEINQKTEQETLIEQKGVQKDNIELPELIEAGELKELNGVEYIPMDTEEEFKPLRISEVIKTK